MIDIDGARKRAQEFLHFSDGFEDAGHPELARRSRVTARDVIDLAGQLEAERSARVAIQRARDQAVAILAEHAHLETVARSVASEARA